jgi:hypothetical protein
LVYWESGAGETFVPSIFYIMELNDSYISIVFVALVVVLWALASRALYVAGQKQPGLKGYANRIILVLSGWIVLTVVLALGGFYREFSAMPPRLALLLLPPIGGIVYLYRSKMFGKLLQEIPHQQIVYAMSFRIVVEFILLRMFIENMMPEQMTFEGRNFDIVGGVTSLFVAYFGIVKQKMSGKAIVVWNVVCALILVNTVINGVLSAPTPFRVFFNEPSTAAIGSFPFALLPGFLVPLAFCLHVLSIRKALGSN